MVTLSDISYEALQVARMNADVHDVRCEFMESDLLQAFKKYKFDLIVSNPPYIAPDEDLMPEIAEFEPETALYAEEDGYMIYRRIAEEARVVKPKAIMLEIGMGQESRIEEVFVTNGYKLQESRKDLAGITRVLTFVPSG
ncbi:MAG: methyltransferase [Fimbriimonadaceae bacterium]